MYSKVKLLRVSGKRKHDRDIQADPGTVGDLTLSMCAGTYELKLAANDDSQQKPLLPMLYDAGLVTMQGDKMLFRGVERGPDGAEFVQEWSVLVMAH